MDKKRTCQYENIVAWPDEMEPRPSQKKPRLISDGYANSPGTERVTCQQTVGEQPEGEGAGLRVHIGPLKAVEAYIRPWKEELEREVADLTASKKKLERKWRI
jgi:hypothetical protein